MPITNLIIPKSLHTGFESSIYNKMYPRLHNAFVIALPAHPSQATRLFNAHRQGR